MTDKLFTIRELWDAVGGTPVDVQYWKWKQNEYFHLAAISPDDHALGWDQDGDHDYFKLIPEERRWRLYTPPKRKVTLYQALIQDCEGFYNIDNELFESEEKARETFATSSWKFVRLLTDRGVECDE